MHGKFTTAQRYCSFASAAQHVMVGGGGGGVVWGWWGWWWKGLQLCLNLTHSWNKKLEAGLQFSTPSNSGRQSDPHQPPPPHWISAVTAYHYPPVPGVSWLQSDPPPPGIRVAIPEFLEVLHLSNCRILNSMIYNWYIRCICNHIQYRFL